MKQLDTVRNYTIEIRCTPKGKRGHMIVCNVLLGATKFIVNALNAFGCSRTHGCVFTEDYFAGRKFIGDHK